MPKKVLIVDDSLFMREMLKDILLFVKEKYDIVEAKNGVDARMKFKKEKPDLTLLDIIMPEGETEGVSVLKEIREISPSAKVIMLTAVGQNAVMEECEKLGVVAYILKPFDKKQVVDAIDGC